MTNGVSDTGRMVPSRGLSRLIRGLFEHVSVQEKVNFSRHLAIIIKAGLPVIDGLRIIQKQTTSRVMRRIIEQLLTDVNSGRPLAESLKNYQHIFGDFFISIVEVGEASGTLGENLLYLSEEMKKSAGFRSKVRSAMIYPTILMVMTVIVSGFLTFYIFPKLIVAFQNLNVALPLSTVILISVLTFLQSYYASIIVGIVVLAVILRILMSKRPVRYFLHNTLFYIPVLSTLVVNINIASFARVFAILLRSGIKIVESLTITSQTLDNLVYRRALSDAAERIKRGEQLAHILVGRPRIFPPIMTGMVEIGEGTGNLEENLTYLSGYYSEEVDLALKNFTAVIEPLILIFMGLIVGFVAISIITPIYSLSQGISR